VDTSSGRIGLGIGIGSVDEFNRRAVIALRGVSHSSEFLTNICARINLRQSLSPDQQQGFINAVYRLSKKITDKLVQDYASSHAKGYES
jgi:hypothetical protein